MNYANMNYLNDFILKSIKTDFLLSYEHTNEVHKLVVYVFVQ